MNNIKVTFSIKDLENLTGIKAHTIRIWEKRYNLLSPNRSDTNIRNYSLTSFQKLLNISYLNNNGLKISKIADLKEEENKTKITAKRNKTSSKRKTTYTKTNVVLPKVIKKTTAVGDSSLNTDHLVKKWAMRWPSFKHIKISSLLLALCMALPLLTLLFEAFYYLLIVIQNKLYNDLFFL